MFNIIYNFYKLIFGIKENKILIFFEIAENTKIIPKNGEPKLYNLITLENVFNEFIQILKK